MMNNVELAKAAAIVAAKASQQAVDCAWMLQAYDSDKDASEAAARFAEMLRGHADGIDGRVPERDERSMANQLDDMCRARDDARRLARKWEKTARDVETELNVAKTRAAKMEAERDVAIRARDMWHRETQRLQDKHANIVRIIDGDDPA